MGQNIKPDSAKKLNENWIGKPGVQSPGKGVTNAGFKDSFETWFSVAELKAYLDYVEKNIPAEEKPGIRIYFGNYGSEAAGNKKNQSTVFLAPTKETSTADSKVVNSNDYTLDAYNSGEQPWPPAPYIP